MIWLLFTLGCGGAEEVPATCDAGDDAWVQQALLLTMRRRPLGSGEVRAWTRTVQQRGRPATLDAMMRTPDHLDGWQDWLLDAMGVHRDGFQEFGACFDEPRLPEHDGQLTAHLRRSGPEQPFGAPFNGADVLRDALVADDLSGVYRAWLLARMSRPQQPCAALTDVQTEAVVRRDFGETFYRTFLNRPVQCLGCHNSQFSVSAAAPLPAHLEAAIFGASEGPADPEDAYTVFRSRALMERSDRLLPWGWDERCGALSTLSGKSRDLLGDTHAFFIEDLGADASVFTLERFLAQGVESVSAGGLAPWDDRSVDGRDAFAYLLAANVADQVFADVTGERLTIAHGLPRNGDQAARLSALADAFAEGFSLRALLQRVVADPVFNAGSPATCDAEPYGLPPIVQPWSGQELEEVRRGNGVGDLVHRLDARTQVRSLYGAMLWPVPSRFAPTGQARELYAGIGAYLRDAEPGFDSANLGSLLTWESATGMCEGHDNDYVARTVRAAVEADATVLDAVVAVKDRLMAQSVVRSEEGALIEAVLGLSLQSTAARDPDALDAGLRALCAVWVVGPDFQLRLDPAPLGAPPRLDVLGVRWGARVPDP
ncbi:MAG: hypothetical protein KTR31_00800 [Myxococcales bacterium]|nr:hypothetical protein [Myxococcales bacterium]